MRNCGVRKSPKKKVAATAGFRTNDWYEPYEYIDLVPGYRVAIDDRYLWIEMREEETICGDELCFEGPLLSGRQAIEMADKLEQVMSDYGFVKKMNDNESKVMYVITVADELVCLAFDKSCTVFGDDNWVRVTKPGKPHTVSYLVSWLRQEGSRVMEADDENS